MKHTQGKWKVENYGHCFAVEVTIPEGSQHTLFTDQFCYASKFNGDAEANAKLIAAAPELFEALYGLMYGHRLNIQFEDIKAEKNYIYALEKANAAIKKATL